MADSMAFDDYHGLHVAAPQAQLESVLWEPSLPRAHRVRVREHTCICQSPQFELCTAGGLWFVRRTSAGASTGIVESAWVSASAANELWGRLLSGQAR